jgi:hypothetical protein
VSRADKIFGTFFLFFIEVSQKTTINNKSAVTYHTLQFELISHMIDKIRIHPITVTYKMIHGTTRYLISNCLKQSSKFDKFYCFLALFLVFYCYLNIKKTACNEFTNRLYYYQFNQDLTEVLFYQKDINLFPSTLNRLINTQQQLSTMLFATI